MTELMNYLFPEHFSDGFILSLEIDFTYGHALNNTFGAPKLSEINLNNPCPINIYFDVELTENNLKYVKDAKYVSFSKTTPINNLFYEYMKSCNNFHVGFCMFNLIDNQNLVLSESIKSLLIASVDAYNKTIYTDHLDYLFLGTHETMMPSCVISNINQIKTILLNDCFALEDNCPISQDYPGILITMPMISSSPFKRCTKDLTKCSESFYFTNLSRLIIIPSPSSRASDEKVYIIVSEKYKDRTELINANDTFYLEF